MSDLGILDQFAHAIPEVALNDIRAKKMKMGEVKDGVSHLGGSTSSGVPFRFFTYADYDEMGSKLAGYEKFNNLDCIEWTIDENNKPVARVADLPTELLEFEVVGYKEVPAPINPNLVNDPYAHPIYGECVGGELKEAYERFKSGLRTPGLPLNKWGILDDSEVATLAKYGLHSVEQFAAKPRSFVNNGKFPISFLKAHERAILYVASKSEKAKDDVLAEKLKAIATESAQKDALLAEQSERIAALERLMLSGGKSDEAELAPIKKRGRPKKEIIDTEN